MRGSVLRRMHLPDRLRIDLEPDREGALVGHIEQIRRAHEMYNRDKGRLEVEAARLEQEFNAKQVWICAAELELQGQPDAQKIESEILELQELQTRYQVALREQKLADQADKAAVAVRNRLAPLGGISAATHNEAWLTELRTRAEKLRASLDLKTSQRTELARLDASAQAAEDAVNGLTSRLTDLEDQIRELVEATPAEVTGLAEMFQNQTAMVLQELRARQDIRNQLQGACSEASEAKKRQEAVLHEGEARIEANASKIRCLDNLGKLKTALIELPRQYVRYRFDQLAVLTQQNLSELNANFSVRPDPETPLSFLFTRLDDGVTLPQVKLSGGQRARLCLAFLMAVQQALVPDVGLLVLDEPSAGLDQEGVASLAEFLQLMGQRLGNTEQQIIIVDHKPELEAFLGKTLVLK